MKFIVSGDWHYASKGPVTRTDDWQSAILNKINQLVRIAVKVKAKAILCPGDVTERKRCNDAAKFDLITLARKLKAEHDIDILTTPGNHDIEHDRLDTIRTQPIGCLFASGALVDCSFSPRTYTDSVDEIHIVGLPFPAANYRDTWDSLICPPTGRTILLAHCFASLEGGAYFGQHVLAYRDLFNYPPDVFVFGHDHSDHGVVTLKADTISKCFINVGALSRGSISRENIDRTIKACILNVTASGITTQEIRLAVSPVSEVFDLALKARKDQETDEVEAYVASLQNDLSDTGDIPFRDRAEKLDISDEVRTRVKKYLDEAEAASCP